MCYKETNYIILVLLTILFLQSQTIWAGQNATKKKEAYELPELRVKGKKAPLPHQSVVEVEDSPARSGQTPVDVMQHEVGLDIQRKGLMVPNSKMIKLRGFDTEKTLVTYGGRPLNGAGVYGGYQIDWTQMPLVDVDKTEIKRGALSAEYGNTIGGVINLVPKKPQEEFQLLLGTGYKRYDTIQGESFMSGKFNPFSTASKYKPLGFTLGASYMETDGYLRNTESERKDLSPALYFYFPDQGFVKFGLRYSDGEFETPITNLESNPDYINDYPESQGHMLVGPGVRRNRRTRKAFKKKNITGVCFGDESNYDKERYEWNFLIKKRFMNVDWKARWYKNYEEREDTYYARADVGNTKKGDRILEKDCPADDSWGTKIKGTTEISKHKLKFGVERRELGYGGVDIDYIDTNYLRHNFSEGPDQEDVIEMDSLFLSDRYSLLDNLEIYLGLRYDDYEADAENIIGGGRKIPEINFDKWSPSIGVYYEPIPDLLTYATFAKTSKFPIIPKYYWYYNGLQSGMKKPKAKGEKYDFERPSLEEEECDQYEAGIEYNGLRNTKIGLSYYYYQDEDYLRWIFGYPRSRVVYNMDEATVQGTELSLRSDLTTDVSGYINWAWQETDIDGAILADKSLSDLGYPEHKVNFGISYKPEKSFLAKLDVKYVSERDEAQGPLVFGSPTNTKVAELDEYWVVNTMLKYSIGDHWRIYGGIDNLLNEDYQETNGFPMPEPRYFVGLEWEL